MRAWRLLLHIFMPRPRELLVYPVELQWLLWAET